MLRVIAKLHRWIGLVLFAYVAMICVTGSVLVYRPELHRYFEPQPVLVEAAAKRLSDEELLVSARRAFPAEEPVKIWPGRQPDHAVEIELVQDGEMRGYMFDPYSGTPLQPALSLGFRATSALLSLHTELLGGQTGRLVNGAIALAVVFLVLTGVLTWTPRKRGLAPTNKPRIASRLRRLHMTVGIWTAAFLFMWAITGIHLVYPGLMAGLVDYLDPFDELNPVERVGDKVSYWLAYLHFGRFGGRTPLCESGFCDAGLKAIWALAALAPVFLAGTGVFLWQRGFRAKLRAKQGHPA